MLTQEPAITMGTLGGMNGGGITKRILDFCNAFLGHITGSLALVNVVAPTTATTMITRSTKMSRSTRVRPFSLPAITSMDA